MDRPHFITPAMSILLDAVRAGAALLVLGGHAVQMGLYTGPYPFGPTMQHNAVIVFFVLSGLVIAHSVQKGGYTLGEYAIARAARIVPVSLFAIGLAAVIYLAVTARGLVPALAPSPYDEFSLAALVMPALFLSESTGGVGPVWNPPYWSLTYEVWFYAIFAAGFFLRGPSRILWIALLCWVAGWKILLMLPIWLLGAGLARYGGAWQPDATRSVPLALAATVCLVAGAQFANPAAYLMHQLHAPFGVRLGFSEFFVTDFVMGLGIAMLFVASKPWAERFHGALVLAKPPIAWFAGFSFSLYILHWPMLSALSALGIGAGDSPLAFAALLGGIIGVCALAAQFTEYRSGDIRRWMASRVLHVRGAATA